MILLDRPKQTKFHQKVLFNDNIDVRKTNMGLNETNMTIQYLTLLQKENNKCEKQNI